MGRTPQRGGLGLEGGPDRSFGNAGKKVFIIDTGNRTVLRDTETMTHHPNAQLGHLSEEHDRLTVVFPSTTVLKTDLMPPHLI